MTDETSIAADLLKSLVERIERLDEEIKDLNADKSEVYKEAKGHGFDVAILRKLIAERRKPAAERAEEEAILELYRDALESAVVSRPRARAREEKPIASELPQAIAAGVHEPSDDHEFSVRRPDGSVIKTTWGEHKARVSAQHLGG